MDDAEKYPQQSDMVALDDLNGGLCGIFHGQSKPASKEVQFCFGNFPCCQFREQEGAAEAKPMDACPRRRRRRVHRVRSRRRGPAQHGYGRIGHHQASSLHDGRKLVRAGVPHRLATTHAQDLASSHNYAGIAHGIHAPPDTEQGNVVGGTQYAADDAAGEAGVPLELANEPVERGGPSGLPSGGGKCVDSTLYRPCDEGGDDKGEEVVVPIHKDPRVKLDYDDAACDLDVGVLAGLRDEEVKKDRHDFSLSLIGNLSERKKLFKFEAVPARPLFLFWCL